MRDFFYRFIPGNRFFTRCHSMIHTKPTLNQKKKRGDFLFIIPFLAVFFALTLPLAGILNIWLDEAYTLNTTGKTVAFAFHRAINFELQPPIYFSVLGIWRNINDSVLFARALSIFSVAGSLLVLSLLCRRLFPNRNPTWMAAWIFLNPALIWAALEIRLYGFLLLLSSLSLYFFFLAYDPLKNRSWLRWAFVLVTVICVYTQYYLGFLLIAYFGALVADRQWKLLMDYLMKMCVVAVCMIPLIWILPGQVALHTKMSAEKPFGLLQLQQMHWRIENYILPASQPLFTRLSGYVWKLGLVFFAWSLYQTRVRTRKNGSENHVTGLMAICLILIAAFTALAWKLGEYQVGPAHTSCMIFPLFLLMYSVIGGSNERLKLACVTAVFVAFNVAYLYAKYEPLAKGGDWRRVSEYLMKNEKPDQPILVFQASGTLPLSRYYKGRNDLTPVPDRDFMSVWDPGTQQVIRTEKDITDALEKRGRRPDEFWLVQNGDEACLSGPIDFGCEILDKYVSANFSVESAQGFYKNKVQHLKRK